MALTATPKRLATAAPATGSNSTLYTATGVTALLAKLMICNPQNTAGTVDVYLVPSAGAAGTGNQIMSGVSMAANETKFFDLAGVVMNAGDFLVVKSTTAQVTYTLSGAEAA